MAGGFRPRGPVATTGPARLLAMDEEGVVCVVGRRSKDRGVFYDGVLYPDELLRDLGGGLYQLATHVEMPADGNTAHNAPFSPVVSVGQLDWTASWESYDRARRRLNLAAMFEKGGQLGNVIRNFLWVCMFAMLVLLTIAFFRAGSASAGVEREVVQLREQLGRPLVVQAAPTATPAPAAPASSSPAPAIPPTVVPQGRP